MEREIYPLAITAYLAIAVVWPTIMTWRRHQVWPVVFHREANASQRLIGALMVLFILGVILWGFLLWTIGPETLGVWPPSPLLQRAGWSLMALGLLGTIVAQRQMGSSWRIGIDDRPTKLIIHGLFRWCRNPIFSGMLATLLGFVLVAPAAWTVAGFLLACCLIAIQVRLEEGLLLRVHGLTYRAYASRVGRFVPFFGRLVEDGPSARFRWAERYGAPPSLKTAPRHRGAPWN
jgi:protein-S-isoprenylcysteine O-methyltransferase Ste14